MEKLLQTKVINYLKKLEKQGVKLFWEKRQAGGLTYKVGLPDLWVVINSIHYEIEFKTPSRSVEFSSEQLFWKNKFKKLGIQSIISNDFEQIRRFIDEKVEVWNK